MKLRDVPEAARLAGRLRLSDETEDALGEISAGGLAFLLPQGPAMASPIREAVIQELRSR